MDIMNYRCGGRNLAAILGGKKTRIGSNTKFV